MEEISPQSSVFCFRGQVLLTAGVYEPIVFHGSLDRSLSLMQKKITRFMNRAIAEGHPAPLVVGALPFEDELPGSLFIPLHYARIPEDLLRKKLQAKPHSRPELTGLTELTGHDHYVRMVAKALGSFHQTGLEKIVLARAVEVNFSGELPWEPVFLQLLNTHPGAFVFSVLLSDGSRLLGASPELLVAREGRQVLSNPLAGSRPLSSDPLENSRRAQDLMRAPKDKREHAIVVRDICNRLRPFCGYFRKPGKPGVINTPTMLHLSTTIRATLSQADTSSLALAAALHPTPAVCGFPTNLARQLISSWEPVKRGMFTGLTGWMDAKGNGQWVVTLRSGVLSGQSLRLGAGAGIVPGSEPECEWMETSAKLKTMLNAVRASCGKNTDGKLSYLA